MTQDNQNNGTTPMGNKDEKEKPADMPQGDKKAEPNETNPSPEEKK